MTLIVTVCHYCKHVAMDGNGYWHMMKCSARLKYRAAQRAITGEGIDRDALRNAWER